MTAYDYIIPGSPRFVQCTPLWDGTRWRPGMTQYTLFDLHDYVNTQKGTYMRGAFAGDSSVNPVTRSASDYIRASDSQALVNAIAAAVNDGVAVLVALTRDRGAVVVTVLDGEKRHKAYANNQEEFDSLVGDLAASFEGGNDTPPNSTVKAPRKR